MLDEWREYTLITVTRLLLHHGPSDDGILIRKRLVNVAHAWHGPGAYHNWVLIKCRLRLVTGKKGFCWRKSVV